MDNTNPLPRDIIIAPAPWICKAQVYALYFYSSRPSPSSSSTALALPPVAYSPLEAASFFASPEAGDFVGGLGSIMVVRYLDTPVGPYDELVIIPGSFVYDNRSDAGWQQTGKKKKCNLRLSRAYVSQEHTCYNGRLNWNIPKHVARFEWSDLPNNGGTHVKVFSLPQPHPNDKTTPTFISSSSSSSSSPSPDQPLFQASFKPIPYLPSFPLSTAWASSLGLMDLSLVNPPVPHGPRPEQVGTNMWCKSLMVQSSPRTSVGWFDMKQPQSRDTAKEGQEENFWPGLGRWRLGVRMDDVRLEVPEGEYWRAE
ncbi:hypothetical protein BD289DRAFT_414644 [Coniella lustricola]|uniref:Acetoacetate decarboxylase n=1 Tax=Coniella lustricola TaxID=2025994 RepID=A0A2T2ZZS7_9PEZI|nr:hypothetical protein BD289DRAFT_414644 [Coniella lustricola]